MCALGMRVRISWPVRGQEATASVLAQLDGVFGRPHLRPFLLLPYLHFLVGILLHYTSKITGCGILCPEKALSRTSMARLSVASTMG